MLFEMHQYDIKNMSPLHGSFCCEILPHLGIWIQWNGMVEWTGILPHYNDHL